MGVSERMMDSMERGETSQKGPLLERHRPQDKTPCVGTEAGPTERILAEGLKPRCSEFSPQSKPQKRISHQGSAENESG